MRILQLQLELQQKFNDKRTILVIVVLNIHFYSPLL